MNIPNANDDEDFPVFKAGPPVPLRTTGTKSHSSKLRNANSNLHTPLRATSTALKGQLSSKSVAIADNATGKISATNSSSVQQPRESKVKQYIERVKASDEIGRKKRVKPEQMLSLEDLYQVKVVNDSPELRQKSQSVIPKSDSVDQVQNRLRATLRIVKEKDELINKLRESCHDLAIKCADAENRVDELRFSYGRSSSVSGGKENQRQIQHRGSVCSEISKQKQHQLQISDVVPRRCISDEELHKRGLEYNVELQNSETLNKDSEKIDKATETAGEITKHDAQTQIELTLCQGGQDQAVGQWQDEDEILQETCSNWMEKVRNWKTDSNFNLSQDSGGDRDSGFRGSAEIDIESVQRQQQQRNLSKKVRKKCCEHGEKLLKIPLATQVPQLSSSSTTTITAARPSNVAGGGHAEEESSLESQHFWPSFSTSQSHFNLSHYQNENLHSNSTKAKSLFYELAESERNKYSCFQEGYSMKHSNSISNCHPHNYIHRHHSYLAGTKSLDALYFPSSNHQTVEELKSLIDSSYDPPETLLKAHLSSQHRLIDKKVKILDPLLDDATQIALRVKMKSERLAKILHDACHFE